MKILFFKKKAVTLLELCIIIAVGAVCVVPLLAMFSTAIRNTVNTESIARSIFLAQELMEEQLTTDFDTLAQDDNHDNVPDRDNTTGIFDWPNRPPEERYRWRIFARFVNPNAADLGQTAAEITTGRSNYLRIRVSVNRVQGTSPEVAITQPVTLSSLVTPR